MTRYRTEQTRRARSSDFAATKTTAARGMGGRGCVDLPPPMGMIVHSYAGPEEHMLNSEERHQIISKYLTTLNALKHPIRTESDLPYSKRLIQKAIIEELCNHPDCELRGHLEVGFAEIESFIPPEDFEMLQEFKETCSQAEALARTGTPGGILASCKLMERTPGERAVRLLERISRAIRDRFVDIQGIGSYSPSFSGKSIPLSG